MKEVDDFFKSDRYFQHLKEEMKRGIEEYTDFFNGNTLGAAILGCFHPCDHATRVISIIIEKGLYNEVINEIASSKKACQHTHILASQNSEFE
ncbi:MAG: hypothetical protein FWC41_07780 [Firmicutes bacterium]|nr:hypothetical protein [Bacillota bacterium]MCL2312370.1 hypothetical protein [Bacillota bacterium]